MTSIGAARTENYQIVNRTGNFQPVGNTVVFDASETSGAKEIALPTNATASDVLVTNSGTKTAFIAFGTATLTATVPTSGAAANGTPVLPGAIMVFDRVVNTWAAVVCAAGETTTLYVTPGVGA